MKTFEKNQKVTHREWGVCTVEKTRNNDTLAWIVNYENGLGMWVTASDRCVILAVNEYKPKPAEATHVLAEFKKLHQMIKDDIKDTDPLSNGFSKGCNSYAKMIDGRIDAILQGAEF